MTAAIVDINQQQNPEGRAPSARPVLSSYIDDDDRPDRAEHVDLGELVRRNVMNATSWRTGVVDVGKRLVKRIWGAAGSQTNVVAIKLVGDGRDGRPRKGLRLTELRDGHQPVSWALEILSEGTILAQHDLSDCESATELFDALARAGGK